MNGHHKRLSGFEVYDKITMEVVPRFKTSSLSGDCWRTSINVTFWFKGMEVRSAIFQDMQTAVLLLGHAYFSPWSETGIEKVEKDRCDQPGCSKPRRQRYVLKREYSAQGELIDATDTSGDPQWRQFCEDHKDRGDCDREDCMTNYEEAK